MKQAETKTKGTVTVHVFGEDLTRTLAFNPPDDITQAELREADFAIDGSQVLYSIAPPGQAKWDPDDDPWTLADALATAENYVAKFLGERGYAVEFD